VKLHRLVLANYRGIEHREIVLPDSGVIVVSGANEIGKSSMIEAIDLLLEAKDRSTRREVKQVKPTHADAGAEVTAEISSGPYRFVYRKRFHQKCETELTVLAPRREQLTGDEAHERVRAILAETVDTELWRAQRVMQAASTASVDLSGCDALSRALDVASQSAALSGDEPLLVDRIEAEYSRYFTPTGRATGEWAAATSRLAEADAEAAGCAAAVAEVDDCVRRHAELSQRLAGLAGQRESAQQRLTAARTAAAVAAGLRAELKEAEVMTTAARATAQASAAAFAERRRLADDAGERERAVAEMAAEAAQAGEDESVARDVRDIAASTAERSGAVLLEAQARADAARATFDRLSDRDEANRLVSRLAKIDATCAEMARVEHEINGMPVTDPVLRDLEVAFTAVERARGQAALASPQIELTATTDLDLGVQRRRIRLSAGESFTAEATEATEIEVPGVLHVRVVPGAPACDTQATLEAASTYLNGLLAAAGVADLADARAHAEVRRELVSHHGRLGATLTGLCGDEPVDQLRFRLAVLRDRGVSAEDTGTDAARAELGAATEAHRVAIAACQRDRDVAAAAGAALAEKHTCAAMLREKLAAARGQLDAARQGLAQQRARASDEDIALGAQADAAAADRAAARVGEVRSRLSQIGPDRIDAELGDAERHADELTRDYDAVAGEIRDLATQLRVYGTEGRKGRLDAAEAGREHADGESARVGRRARAVQLLRAVILRHRDDSRLRYVEPFRAEIQRLGRIVFGDTFEVEIDSSLSICSRTLAGRTVPYESLSGGAKEQLGIIARLAGAALVAEEDSVPVIIDDALGFTDSHRLARMGAVFDAVGSDAQVLVLTCSPRRYDSVKGAHHIELTA